MNAISDLWNGRPGLAKTYWLWGVLSGIPWGIALSLVTPGSNLAILVVLAFFAYYVIVHVGIWRSASEYEGAKAWAILAKIAVSMAPVCLVIGTLAAVIIPATHQPPKQAQEITPTTQTSAKDDKPALSPSNSIYKNAPENRQQTKTGSIFLSCTLSSPLGVQNAYTFEFNPSKNYLLWIEGTKELDIIRNTDSQLWGVHDDHYHPFAYDQTSFQLNRASGNVEIFYSRKPTLDEISNCKKGHNFGCDSWFVLTEHTETGVCKRQERQI